MIAKPIRFLILRGGAIGDFMVTLPAITAIRTRWPAAYIELIGYPHIARLAFEGGLVDKVESLDRAGIAAFFAHRPAFSAERVSYIRSFDLVFTYLHDSNGVVRENLLLAGAKQVIYGSPLVSGDWHAVDHLLKPLEALAIYESGAAPRLPVPKASREASRTFLRDRGYRGRVFALHPGSGSPRKNWPVDRFEEVARRLEAEGRGTPLYLFGEADVAARREVEGRIPPERMVDALALVEVAGLLSVCDAYVGNDSGITHLAAAVGRPVLALFGPSSGAQWGPRGENVTILQADGGDLQALSVDEVWRHMPAP